MDTLMVFMAMLLFALFKQLGAPERLTALLEGESLFNDATAVVVFTLLVGVTITVGMFTSHWLAMLIGIAAATAARAGVIYLLLPATNWVLPGDKIPGSYRHVMMWGGLRGAVSLALALSLPLEIESWYSIQSIVYGVVLFTLFVQAPLMPPLVRKTV
jgi:CPA1 family monovalent cation:H+ antiporter